MERTNDSVFHFVVEFKPYYHIAPVYPTLPAQLDIRIPVSRVHAYIYIYIYIYRVPEFASNLILSLPFDLLGSSLGRSGLISGVKRTEQGKGRTDVRYWVSRLRKIASI